MILDDLIKYGLQMIDQTLKERGAIVSVVYIYTARADGATEIGSIPFKDDNKEIEAEMKMLIITEVQGLRRAGLLRGCVIVGEVWLAPLSADLLPSKHPDRKEAAIVAVYDALGERRILLASLERQGSSVRRGPEIKMPTEEMEGWLDPAFTDTILS